MTKELPGAILLVILSTISCSAGGNCADRIKVISPAELGFFTKEIDCLGIPIKSSEVVSNNALYKADNLLNSMLGNAPDIVANLRQSGSELHIIGRNQATSDLPEHKSKKGKPFDGEQDIDTRTRGVGGLFASCGEENLLGLPEDRYYSRHSPGSICVHEFAHNILNYGLDDNIRQRWREQFMRSTQRGLWKSTYASTNYDEYFAELSMWYFGGLGDAGKLSPVPQAGKGWLQNYDPDAFRLMESIYTGKLRPARLPAYVEIKSLPVYSESNIRSQASTISTSLKIINKTSNNVDIFWLDFEGHRQPYGSLEPGEIAVRQTYASHPWVLTDKRGVALAIFVANAEPSMAILRP